MTITIHDLENKTSLNHPRIVALGGDLTITDAAAKSYARMIKRILRENKISGIDVYSVQYDFGPYQSKIQRAELFHDAGQRISRDPRSEFPPSTFTRQMPKYISELFNALIREAVLDADGKRLGAVTAAQNMSRIMFYTHCHGAATVSQLTEYMRRVMLDVGYTTREIKNIQKNTLVIQHAPLAPLTKLAFTTLSFASADDAMLDHKNKFSHYIGDNSMDITTTFFPAPYGNIFVGGRLKEQDMAEHDHRGLLKLNTNGFLTDDGREIFQAEYNAIVRGAHRTLTGGAMPSIRDMVSGGNVDFDLMEQNGQRFIAQMIKDIRRNR